jgi:putative exporter of polyketide antibiotics
MNLLAIVLCIIAIVLAITAVILVLALGSKSRR